MDPIIEVAERFETDVAAVGVSDQVDLEGTFGGRSQAFGDAAQFDGEVEPGDDPGAIGVGARPGKVIDAKARLEDRSPDCADTSVGGEPRL